MEKLPLSHLTSKLCIRNCSALKFVYILKLLYPAYIYSLPSQALLSVLCHYDKIRDDWRKKKERKLGSFFFLFYCDKEQKEEKGGPAKKAKLHD